MCQTPKGSNAPWFAPQGGRGIGPLLPGDYSLPLPLGRTGGSQGAQVYHAAAAVKMPSFIILVRKTTATFVIAESLHGSFPLWLKYQSYRLLPGARIHFNKKYIFALNPSKGMPAVQLEFRLYSSVFPLEPFLSTYFHISKLLISFGK